MLPVEAFLSHSARDREFVDELAAVLRRHSVPVWYSRTNITGAQQWHDEIGAALGRCDWFVLVLSKNPVESMWVRRVLMFALQQYRFENRIVPVLTETCDFERLSWVLPSFQFVDFATDRDEGYRQLFRLWGIGYRPE
jgi:hypothetical protein